MSSTDDMAKAMAASGSGERLQNTQILNIQSEFAIWLQRMRREMVRSGQDDALVEVAVLQAIASDRKPPISVKVGGE